MQKKSENTLPPQTESEITIRDYRTEDQEFIYATLLNHYKHSSLFAKRIRNTIYFKEHQNLIKNLFDRGAIKKICCPSNDPVIILGYLIMEGTKTDPVIHFVYVKKAFRDMGIAELLTGDLDLNNTQFTHWTEDCEWITNKYPGMKYNPYKLWRNE